MICSRMFAGVDQSILRSTRNPLLNQDANRCTTSRSTAARSLFPSSSCSRDHPRIATRSLVPPGARLSRRISSCRRGSTRNAGRWRRRRSVAPARLRVPRKVWRGPTETRPGPRRTMPAGGIQIMVAVEHLARQRGPGRLAATREQGLRTVQAARRRLAWFRKNCPPQQRAATGNRRKQVGEERVGHGSSRIQRITESTWNLRPCRSQSSATLRHAPRMRNIRYASFAVQSPSLLEYLITRFRGK